MLAITVWENRVAPVFDVAGSIILINCKNNQTREQHNLPTSTEFEKISFLKKHHVDELVCGAISNSVLNLAQTNGIQVHSFIAGDIDEIIKYWCDGTIKKLPHTMPGCKRNRQRGRNKCKNRLT